VADRVRWLTARVTAGVVRAARVPVVVDAAVILAASADALPGFGYLGTFDRALVVLAVAALLLRRRWPLLAWALAAPAQFTAVVVVPSVLALYSLAVRARHRWVLVLAGVVMFLGNGAFLSTGPVLEDLAVDTVYGLMFAIGPIALGLLVRTRAELSARVVDLHAAHAQERDRAAADAVARERAVLAREMHDVVSHQVSLIAVQSGALQVSAPDGQTREIARTIRQLCVATLHELREMVGVLRAEGGTAATIRPQPVLADLPELIEAGDLRVDARVDLPADLPLPVQRAIFRVVQEALTNARKHATDPEVLVRAATEPHGLVVEVRSTGRARAQAALPGSGYGIVGLRERAELLGGEVSTREDAAGFTIVMRLPRQPGA
jgi:signal transduction histidine kinase